MPIFRFKTLWENHPNVKGDTPILDKKAYGNQCAINLCAALIRSGVSFEDYRGAMSWQKGKPKYAIRAQELANWLSLRPRFPGSSVVKIKPKNFEDEISKKSGVIFFQNYWGRGNQGDHIDLWDGSQLTYTESIAQIYLRFESFGYGSDFHKAESIWFWGVS